MPLPTTPAASPRYVFDALGHIGLDQCTSMFARMPPVCPGTIRYPQPGADAADRTDWQLPARASMVWQQLKDENRTEQRTLNPRGVHPILLRRTYSDLRLSSFRAVISRPICPRAGSVLARVFSGPPGVAVNSCSDWPIPAWIGACTDVTQRKECRQEA
jgi:hypothetical protein